MELAGSTIGGDVWVVPPPVDGVTLGSDVAIAHLAASGVERAGDEAGDGPSQVAWLGHTSPAIAARRGGAALFAWGVGPPRAQREFRRLTLPALLPAPLTLNTSPEIDE